MGCSVKLPKDFGGLCCEALGAGASPDQDQGKKERAFWLILYPA